MVVLQKSDNQLYADIVRCLKQNFRSEFQPPFVAPHGERKVRIRTGCHYQSQLPEDHWREKYNRNVKQSVRGFYTPAHVPYASVGDVCLDVKDLVVKTVGGEQSPEKFKNSSLAADLCEQEKKKDEDHVEISQKKQKLQGSKKRACFLFQDQGGLSEIKAKLSQYQGRLSALRAGQTFQECLKKEDFMLMYIEAMKESSQNQAECAMSPADKLKTILNKMRPSERLDAPLLGDELIPALPNEIKPEHEEEIIDQRDVHDRYVRNFSGKLSCIYTLLCYIYHLRTRDLRTKAPLSRDFLKALKTEVLTDQKGRPLRHTRNMCHIQPQSRGTGNQRSSTDVPGSRMEHDNNLSPHMNTRASFVSDSPSSLFRTGITGTGAIDSRASFVVRKIRVRDTSDKIETWDDLLEAGEKPPSNPQAPWPGMARSGAANEAGARGGVTRTSFLNTAGWKMTFGGMRQRRYGILQSLVNQTQNVATVEQTPLWHQVAISEKNAKDNGKSGTFTKRRVKKSPSKIENSLSGMMSEGFEKIQTKSAERVRSKLNKLNRKERESFVRKVLVLEPSSLYKVDLKRVQQAGTDVSEDCDKEDVKTARWFGDLEREAQELGLQREIGVICSFSKLYPFAIDDVTTIPFAQAKLCLVVQSLPIYELCSLPMMDALKFLLVNILNTSTGTFDEWMNQRKLLPAVKSN